MSEIYKPRIYQNFITRQIVDNETMKTDGAGILVDMGLGKTAATLTAVDELMFVQFAVNKPLIIAPKYVAKHTWTDEIKKWAHTKHLTCSQIMGTLKQRMKAIEVKADVYIINRENVSWLVRFLGSKWDFDMVVIDELSSFKSSKSDRFRALKMVRPKIKRIVGLTGTPVPNGMLDLWAQIYLLDGGKRLGATITGYREKYFKSDPYKPYANYELRDNDGDAHYYQNKIFDKVKDICVSMKREDWLELPKRIDLTRTISLSGGVQRQYDEFERDEVLKMADVELTAVNAGALINKLLQFANGAVYYDEGRKFYEVHNEKIDVLEELLEEANGKPVLVSYQFRSDVERIKTHLRRFKPVLFTERKEALADWNNGKIQLLLGHCASMGHGLNMQFGGNLIAHFGLGWSLEGYQQIVHRLDRPGQTEPVRNTRLICAGTYDTETLSRMDGKAQAQESFLQAVKALIRKYQ